MPPSGAGRGFSFFARSAWRAPGAGTGMLELLPLWPTWVAPDAAPALFALGAGPGAAADEAEWRRMGEALARFPAALLQLHSSTRVLAIRGPNIRAEAEARTYRIPRGDPARTPAARRPPPAARRVSGMDGKSERAKARDAVLRGS